MNVLILWPDPDDRNLIHSRRIYVMMPIPVDRPPTAIRLPLAPIGVTYVGRRPRLLTAFFWRLDEREWKADATGTLHLIPTYRLDQQSEIEGAHIALTAIFATTTEVAHG